ncbi:hypothetical protein VAEU17_4280205 [Vibrio aestuarianus]|nr:hypothetical protein VAEU17_4280205 [Vibrio aestuarianus]
MLTTPDTEHRSRFTTLDEKVEVDGTERTKYIAVNQAYRCN